MILISHRGNTNGLNPKRENSPEYIDEAIKFGYNVEIDVRLIESKLYLGHDTPDHEISLEWLLNRKSYLWIHTKNYNALSYLIDKDVRTFFHKGEDHVIINNCNLIWSHALNDLSLNSSNSIIPLLSEEEMKGFNQDIKIHGICSDFVDLFIHKERLI